LRIPFDTTVLTAVTAEIRPFVGGKVQRIVQPDDTTVTIELYGGKENGIGCVLLSCHAELYRMHLVTRRYKQAPSAPAFCTQLRARLEGRHLSSLEQVNGDRIVRFGFEDGHALIVELMGKHSNLMLLEPGKKVVAAAKWVAKSKSIRPIQPGRLYEQPPVLGEGLSLSPFAKKLLVAGGTVEGPVHPILSQGNGAYPYSIAALGISEISKPSISIALEQHYDAVVPAAAAASQRAALMNALNRVLISREAAVSDLRQAVERGNKADQLQREGELILAYGPSVPEGSSILEAVGYDGKPTAIRLDPELNFKENAQRAFSKARKAKDRLDFASDQLARLTKERDDVAGAIAGLEQTESLKEIESIQTLAVARRWLHTQHHAENVEDRPFAGHRVRDILGPGGIRVLYGENAESNDYLTLRVAKPNDIWLHVRGGTSAHVVIATNNKPDRIGQEALLFAARVAVKNSPAKHSGIVAVDYTLKKYVRKSRGAPMGSAFYTHEKTLHVSPE
jgi:predicted ribosome quality control (RQC) complex YloA/Tae2 family protein